MLFTVSAWGQTTEAVDPHFIERLFGDIVVFSAAIVVIAAFLTLAFLSRMLMESQKMRILEEQGVEVLEKAGIRVKQPSWWSRLYKNATKLVPIEKEKDILFDHEYDGIRELDNSLPPWWLAMFYISIIAAVAYMYVYHISDIGLSQHESYALELEEAEKAIEAYRALQPDLVDESNVEALTAEDAIALGESLYKFNCAACHGQLGEGGIGPNLTDPYWIYGGGVKDVFKTIKYGVPEKGMIAWKAQLRPADMQRLASFILTLQNSNPPNQKEPQGELYEGGDESEATDEESIGMRE